MLKSSSMSSSLHYFQMLLSNIIINVHSRKITFEKIKILHRKLSYGTIDSIKIQ